MILQIVMIAMIFVSCGKEEEVMVREETLEVQEEPEAEVLDGGLFVYVCGQVNEPGVYELAENDRILHAIEAAGGFTKEAASDYLNLAELIQDGQKIYVPDKTEAYQEKNGSTQKGMVNINKATKEELMTLSGIGESRAEAIISYREKKGNFKKIEDLKQIEGIKEGIFLKIQDKIVVQ